MCQQSDLESLYYISVKHESKYSKEMNDKNEAFNSNNILFVYTILIA